MAVKKIIAVIEASSTGFGIYSDQLAGITGYAKTVAEAKKDFESAIEETIESYKKEELPKQLRGNFEFEFKI